MPAENLLSRLVMPVELVLVLGGAGGLPLLLLVPSPLVEGETSGLSSKTPLSRLLFMIDGRDFVERTTTVAGVLLR